MAGQPSYNHELDLGGNIFFPLFYWNWSSDLSIFVGFPLPTMCMIIFQYACNVLTSPVNLGWIVPCFVIFFFLCHQATSPSTVPLTNSIMPLFSYIASTPHPSSPCILHILFIWRPSLGFNLTSPFLFLLLSFSLIKKSQHRIYKKCRRALN